jgi:hypothetical protein
VAVLRKGKDTALRPSHLLVHARGHIQSLLCCTVYDSKQLGASHAATYEMMVGKVSHIHTMEYYTEEKRVGCNSS